MTYLNVVLCGGIADGKGMAWPADKAAIHVDVLLPAERLSTMCERPRVCQHVYHRRIVGGQFVVMPDGKTPYDFQPELTRSLK